MKRLLCTLASILPVCVSTVCYQHVMELSEIAGNRELFRESFQSFFHRDLPQWKIWYKEWSLNGLIRNAARNFVREGPVNHVVSHWLLANSGLFAPLVLINLFFKRNGTFEF